MNKVAGVYAIECKVNGHMIVGSAKDIYKRWSDYRSKLNKGTYSNRLLQGDWGLYGAEAFEFKILEVVSCMGDLYEREKYWMEQMGKNCICLYNMRKIKNTKKKLRRGKESAKHRALMSEINKGEKNPRAKLNEDEVREIKNLLKEKVRVKDIAKQFGVSVTLVSYIKSGERWGHVA